MDILFLLILLLLAFSERLLYQLEVKRGIKTVWSVLFRCLIVVCISYNLAYLLKPGVDYQDYRNVYDNGFSFAGRNRAFFEYGYQLLNVLFREIGFSFQQFHFIYCIGINSLIVAFIYRYKYPVLSLLAFIVTAYYQESNVIRQMMSIAIFLYSTKYITGKDIKKYLVCIFMACLFHASSVILLPMYWVNRLKPYPLIMMILLGISIYVANSRILMDLLMMVSMDSLEYGTLYSFLMERESVSVAGNVIMFSFLLLAFLDKKNLLNKERNVILIIFFIGAFLKNFTTYGINFYRISLYFYTAGVVIIPQVIDFVNSFFCNKLKINIGMAKYLIYLLVLIFYVNAVLKFAD